MNTNRIAAHLSRFCAEYFKHAVLNLGQALQGIRFVHSHPDIDAVAQRGTPRHVLLSLVLRTRRIANDLFFAAIPPHWHHSADELQALHREPVRRWFQYGYCAWRFLDADATRPVDRRWDPRCRGADELACR